MDIVAIDYNVAEIDPDAPVDAAVGQFHAIAFGHAALPLDRFGVDGGRSPMGSGWPATGGNASFNSGLRKG
jgi:hypothetical protein